jgi:Signal transduction histidine kinase
METLKTSAAAKTAAFLLVVISLVLSIAGFVGMVMMDTIGGYQMSKEEMLKKGYEEMCGKYSVMALAAYKDQYDAKELAQTNFRYGIVKAKDIRSVDFSDLGSYVAGNFEQPPKEAELYFNEYDITKDTQFEFFGRNILDSSYSMFEPSVSQDNYDIQGWVYDMESETIYVRADKKLFATQDAKLCTQNDGITPLYTANSMIREQINGDQTKYTWEDDSLYLFLPDADHVVDISEIAIVNGKDSLKTYGAVQKGHLDAIGQEQIYVSEQDPYEHLIVASYVHEPLSGELSFTQGDLFVQTKILVDFAYRMRYAGIVILIVSVVVLIAAFSFLMAAAGHRRGEKGICASFLDRVPLDLSFAGFFFAETLLAFLMVWFMEIVAPRQRNGMSGMVSAGVVFVCAGIAAVFLCVLFCMSFAVHIKLGKWWRHTVIYLVFRKCVHVLAGALHFCGYVCASLLKSVTLLWKAWIVLGVLAFAEFLALEASWADGSLFAFWLLEKAIVYPAAILLLIQMHRLQRGAQQIANGRLDYRIDTRHMFWEVKKHGEYLNDIGHGINNAVNERMKSERFKTELITNVSHDIKTPLTSIINYVDLLQKEEIDNPAVQEYLEVLHRQSARLKKLIEDLMEASKASTGSLSVVMEQCDAGVMLVQTIGEFEEKLMAEQIELQIKKPETEIFIGADHRHLWRVFDNLMNNICKYAQPATRAYVNLEQDGGKAVIIFRNISKYQLNISSEELMERFVRGDSSRNTEGSGLGISIAKSLTELMNGTFALYVDGDLFKVVLTFPLYGEHTMHLTQRQPLDAVRLQEKNDHMLMDGLAAGLQNAGSYAAGIGQGVADKTGKIVRRAGRFAYHVKQAAKQVKEEEALERAVENANQEKQEEPTETENRHS